MDSPRCSSGKKSSCSSTGRQKGTQALSRSGLLRPRTLSRRPSKNWGWSDSRCLNCLVRGAALGGSTPLSGAAQHDASIDDGWAVVRRGLQAPPGTVNRPPCRCPGRAAGAAAVVSSWLALEVRAREGPRAEWPSFVGAAFAPAAVVIRRSQDRRWLIEAADNVDRPQAWANSRPWPANDGRGLIPAGEKANRAVSKTRNRPGGVGGGGNAFRDSFRMRSGEDTRGTENRQP